MTTYKAPYTIAEIGGNHKGDMEIAKEMIKVAAIFCNVDAVKFQKRHNRELLTEKQYNAPHPNLIHSYGDTYGAHREFLEFDVCQHRELKEYCEGLGITYASSVWDTTSAKEIAGLHPAFIKIRAISRLSSRFLGPSSTPGKIWQCRSIIFISYKLKAKSSRLKEN